MSLSQEPAFSLLKNYFVCGFTDITNQSHAGISGRHERQGNATNTSNGAGPHNLQLFMLASDGTVLHCLPGYWDPRDLSQEMKFAHRLNKVYSDRTLRKSEKDQLFKQMQLSHIAQHSPQMIRRSHMQGFDQQYEAHYKLNTSDTILDAKAVKEAFDETGHVPGNAFKTTDVLLHERMAKRPFLPFSSFDVANFSDYGKPFYNKNEDGIDAHSGRTVKEWHGDSPTIGDKSHAERITQEHKSRASGESQQRESGQWGQANTPSGDSWDGRNSAQNGSGWGSSNYASSHGWGAESEHSTKKKAK